MKTNRFRDSVVTRPEKNKDGTWSFQEFPPLGGDIYRGDFASRAAARRARTEVLHAAQGTGSNAERIFARA